MHVAEVCLLVLAYTAPRDRDFGGSHVECSSEAFLLGWLWFLCLMGAPKVADTRVLIPHSLWLSPRAVPGSFRNKIIIVGDL